MIYENIVKLCQKRGITIARLEKESGLGNATVRGWEDGIPRVDKLQAVANYFGVTVDDLLKEDGDKE